MIQSFSVKNFLSIGAQQTISFEATSDKTHLDEVSVEVKPGLRLLRLVFFFGANASGKSNLLYAIDVLWRMMFSPKYEEHKKIKLYTPFETHKGEPTEFSIEFWAVGRKFKYFLSYNEDEILEENLMYTTDRGILSKLYDRTKQIEITFGSTISVKAQEKNNIKTNTLKNHTVLSTLNKTNIDIPILNELYQWIKKNVHEENSHNNEIEIATKALENPNLKSMLLGMLKKADFNITNFELIPNSAKLPDKLKQIFAGTDFLKNFQEISYDLIFTHSTAQQTFKINSQLESRGTLMYFRLAYMLYDLKDQESVCIKDEIEDSLHYDLLIHYLKIFLENHSKNQLICSTHTLPILSEDWMIRRDMIWFVDKNKLNGETETYNASSLGLHKNISLENAYRIGKLGALPKLGSTLIWED